MTRSLLERRMTVIRHPTSILFQSKGRSPVYILIAAGVKAVPRRLDHPDGE